MRHGGLITVGSAGTYISCHCQPATIVAAEDRAQDSQLLTDDSTVQHLHMIIHNLHV